MNCSRQPTRKLNVVFVAIALGLMNFSGTAQAQNMSAVQSQASATSQETPSANPNVAVKGGPPLKKIVKPRFKRPSFLEEMKSKPISYSQAIDIINDGGVDSAVKHYSSRLVVFYMRLHDKSVVSFVPAAAGEIEKDFSNQGVDLTVEDGDYMAEAMRWMSFLTSTMFLFFMIFLGVNTAKKFVGNPARTLTKSRRGEKTTFADVAGQDEAKLELKEIVDFLREPAKFSGLGARVPRGVLLDGPPGNGKTLLAKAIAGEANVAFLQISGDEFMEIFAGLGARRVRKMFKAARRHRNGCILFIDEIDVLAGKRGNGSGSDVQAEREQTVTAFLKELDGIETRGNIVLIGATNRPEAIDPAVLRPGRIDRKVHVPLPDTAGRRAIIAIHVRKIVVANDVTAEELARMTPGFSGAELENMINEAAIYAGRKRKLSTDMDCFHAARDKALMGEARSLVGMDAEDRRIAALHEAGHALVALRTPDADPVHKATILPRGRSLGMVMQLPERERKMHSRAWIEARLHVMMAGRAAEEAVYGRSRVTSGASQDISEATKLVRMMIGRLGMDENFGCMDYLGDGDMRDAASPQTMARLDYAIAAKIGEFYAAALGIVSAELQGLHALADALQERETLNGTEILEILDKARENSNPKTGLPD